MAAADVDSELGVVVAPAATAGADAAADEVELNRADVNPPIEAIGAHVRLRNNVCGRALERKVPPHNCALKEDICNNCQLFAPTSNSASGWFAVNIPGGWSVERGRGAVWQCQTLR